MKKPSNASKPSPSPCKNADLPLEDALAAYQEGSQLVKYCRDKLAQAEQKLHILDSDGLIQEYTPR